jgi:hypothetical protein
VVITRGDIGDVLAVDDADRAAKAAVPTNLIRA